MKIAYKYRIIISLYALLPIAVVYYCGVKSELFFQQDFQIAITLSTLVYFLILLFSPVAGLKWLFLKQFREVESYCKEIKKGNYETYFDLPNQPMEDEDDNELVFLMRNINWMTRQIDVRERMLKGRNEELATKNFEIHSLLENMRQGIFSFSTDNKILPDFSSQLIDILETDNIVNQPVLELLFTNSDITSDQINQLESSIQATIGEDILNFEVNSHLFIEKYKKKFEDGREKVLELFWNPIIDEFDVVKRLMVVVKDVTRLEVLKRQSEEQQRHLEIIGQIIRKPIEEIEIFLKSASGLLDDCQRSLEEHPVIDEDLISNLFRNLHTLKGNARAMGFTDFSDRVHRAENDLDDLRTGAQSWSSEDLEKNIMEIRHGLQEYRSVIDMMPGQASNQADKLSGETLNNLFRITRTMGKILNQSPDPDIKDLKNTHSELEKTLMGFNAVSLKKLINSVSEQVPKIMKELEKPVPENNFLLPDVSISKDSAEVIRNCLNHLIKNSLDHGIESPEIRKQMCKPEKGTLHLNVRTACQELLIDFYDDGQGLNLNKIKETALEQGLMNPNQTLSEQIIFNLIFGSGFSTANEVSEISGRGVGLDAVHQHMKEIGGAIELSLNQEFSKNEFCPFLTRLKFPLEHVISIKE